MQQFYKFSDIKFKKIIYKENNRLKNKFSKLSTTTDFSLIDKTDIDKWVINLTSIDIPDTVKETIALGPKFCSVSKPSNSDIVTTIKNVESTLRNSEIDTNEQKSIRQKIVKHICTVRSKSSHNSLFQRSISKMVNTTREFLKKNDKIMCTYSDKGNSTVCIEKSVYTSKMLDLLNDNNTYTVNHFHR